MRSRLRLTVLVAMVVPAPLAGRSRGVPTPESVFGFKPGAGYTLASFVQ